jgi:hypothetical protein
VDEAGALEHPDVLRHGLEGYVERLCQLTDGALALGDASQDATTCAVRKSMEDAIEPRSTSLKHVLEYRRDGSIVKDILEFIFAGAYACLIEDVR